MQQPAQSSMQYNASQSNRTRKDQPSNCMKEINPQEKGKRARGVCINILLTKDIIPPGNNGCCANYQVMSRETMIYEGLISAIQSCNAAFGAAV